MFGPKRANGKLLEHYGLIKNINLLKFIEIHLEVKRCMDGQVAALIRSVILKDDSSAVTSQDDVLSILLAEAKVDA